MPADSVVVIGVPVVDSSTVQVTVVSTRSPTVTFVPNSGVDGADDDVDMTAVYISVGVICGLFVALIIAFVFHKMLQKKEIETINVNIEISKSVDSKSGEVTTNPMPKCDPHDQL